MHNKFAKVIRENKDSWKTWGNKWPKILKMVKGVVDPKTGKWDSHGGGEDAGGQVGKVGKVPKWGETD